MYFCDNCRDTGWDRNARSGDYDGVCGDCAGSAVYVARSWNLPSAREFVTLRLPVPARALVGDRSTRRLVYVSRSTGEPTQYARRVWEAP